MATLNNSEVYRKTALFNLEADYIMILFILKADYVATSFNSNF